ncbi:hypothetical protein D8674_029562 [Pyrus ussuriensis x Pyrus communis]|uniref:Uncharacterized protein n=1 Tax=Pyrus ussuriensis x Pyrus communis TaxID=2448454 RepID=A0A5N5HZE2_9ROSA|nr:hypothetical protein D8674_029562 [Pyrus ussuriensis x Pyrus communis]
MNGSSAKLVAITALVLLLMGDFQATCGLLPYGCFECQSDILSTKVVPVRRSLRPFRSRPSPPLRNPPIIQPSPRKPLPPPRPPPPPPPPPPPSPQ